MRVAPAALVMLLGLGLLWWSLTGLGVLTQEPAPEAA